MRKILLINGDLATGKTTFAKFLAKRYNLPLFFKDSIKEMLGETVGFSDRAENRRLSVAAGKILNLIFAELARRGEGLILESNFRGEELEELYSLAEANGYQVMCLVLRAELDILHARFLERMKNENRHPVHFSRMLEDFSDFERYITELRAEKIPGDFILVDANDFAYQRDEKLLSIIDSFFDKP